MYCAGCGTSVNDKLNYCNVCGAKLVKEDGPDATSVLNNFLTAIVVVVLGGFGILVGMLAILLYNGVQPKDAGLIALFFLVSLTVISFMLLRLLPRLLDAKLNEEKAVTRQTYQAPQIKPKATAQLEEHREPAVSVTEHTTRNFEKVPR